VTEPGKTRRPAALSVIVQAARDVAAGPEVQSACYAASATAVPCRAPERIPSAVRVVTITELASLGPDVTRPPAPVTIADLAVVRRLAALVDSLQLSTIGPAASCPPPPGDEIQLTFLARAGGPPLAVAQGPAACGTVQFSVDGKPQPALQITDSFIPQVLKLADLDWKVP
jgi:hypothetical protein